MIKAARHLAPTPDHAYWSVEVLVARGAAATFQGVHTDTNPLPLLLSVLRCSPSWVSLRGV